MQESLGIKWPYLKPQVPMVSFRMANRASGNYESNQSSLNTTYRTGDGNLNGYVMHVIGPSEES